MGCSSGKQACIFILIPHTLTKQMSSLSLSWEIGHPLLVPGVVLLPYSHTIFSKGVGDTSAGQAGSHNLSIIPQVVHIPWLFNWVISKPH